MIEDASLFRWKISSNMIERITPQLSVIVHLPSLFCVINSNIRLLSVPQWFFFLQYAFWMLYSLDILSSFCFPDISVVFFLISPVFSFCFPQDFIVACSALETHFYRYQSFLYLWSYCPECVAIEETKYYTAVQQPFLFNDLAIFSRLLILYLVCVRHISQFICDNAYYYIPYFIAVDIEHRLNSLGH